MKSKYEIIEVNQAEITVDVSLLSKTEEMFFNATEMAKPFGKRVQHFLSLESTQEYMEEIFKSRDSTLLKQDDLIRTTRGKYGGTWLHKELAFEFAGWCEYKKVIGVSSKVRSSYPVGYKSGNRL